MVDTKQTKSTSTKEAGDTKFDFCCGGSEKMTEMMRKFCSGEDATLDCGKMMQMMCCSALRESGKQ